jgi:hypothetical protein
MFTPFQNLGNQTSMEKESNKKALLFLSMQNPAFLDGHSFSHARVQPQISLNNPSSQGPFQSQENGCEPKKISFNDVRKL